MRLYKERITEMAVPKADVENMIKDIYISVGNHIIKSIIYGNSTGSFNHWVNQELSSWFTRISHFYTKTPSARLSLKRYRELLFDNYANTSNDMYVRIDIFKDKYVFGSIVNPYPDFELTDALAIKVFRVFSSVRDTICPMLTSKFKYSKEDFSKILQNTIDNLSSEVEFR